MAIVNHGFTGGVDYKKVPVGACLFFVSLDCNTDLVHARVRLSDCAYFHFVSRDCNTDLVHHGPCSTLRLCVLPFREPGLQH